MIKPRKKMVFVVGAVAMTINVADTGKPVPYVHSAGGPRCRELGPTMMAVRRTPSVITAAN